MAEKNLETIQLELIEIPQTMGDSKNVQEIEMQFRVRKKNRSN